MGNRTELMEDKRFAPILGVLTKKYILKNEHP